MEGSMGLDNFRILMAFTVLWVAAAFPSAAAATRLKLDSVPPVYLPTAGPELPEPVSMQHYTFEVNQQTRRARVVVDYTYPDQLAFGADGGAGPAPGEIQVPGLTYDPEAHTVVYNSAGTQTVCATVRNRKFLFWKSTSVNADGLLHRDVGGKRFHEGHWLGHGSLPDPRYISRGTVGILLAA
jgi:hypothetical protein